MIGYYKRLKLVITRNKVRYGENYERIYNKIVMKTSHGLLTLTIVYYSRNYVIGHSKIDMRKVVSYL